MDIKYITKQISDPDVVNYILSGFILLIIVIGSLKIFFL